MPRRREGTPRATYVRQVRGCGGIAERDSLNGYAPNNLEATDYALWEEYFNADGDEHKEFCDIFGPEHILPNVGEFLDYFMVCKVMASQDFLRAADTVTKKLAKWLMKRGHVSPDEAEIAVEQGTEATHNLPQAEKLGSLFV